MRQVDWDAYLFDYMMGVKTYLLKDQLEEIPKARRSLAWLVFTHVFLKFLKYREWWIENVSKDEVVQLFFFTAVKFPIFRLKLWSTLFSGGFWWLIASAVARLVATLPFLIFSF